MSISDPDDGSMSAQVGETIRAELAAVVSCRGFSRSRGAHGSNDRCRKKYDHDRSCNVLALYIKPLPDLKCAA